MITVPAALIASLIIKIIVSVMLTLFALLVSLWAVARFKPDHHIDIVLVQISIFIVTELIMLALVWVPGLCTLIKV